MSGVRIALASFALALALSTALWLHTTKLVTADFCFRANTSRCLEAMPVQVQGSLQDPAAVFLVLFGLGLFGAITVGRFGKRGAS